MTYRVVNSRGETVVVTTRKEDAEAFLPAGKIDRDTYKIVVDNTTK